MKVQLRKHLLTCALLAGVGLSVAHAQTAPAAPTASGASAPQVHAKRHHHDPARMAERMNRHLADLKQKLQLNAGQESAWASFTAALQPTAKGPRPDREAIARMSTPDRIDHLRSMRERRNAEMDRRFDATKAFYAQLGAEQQKTFDSETARLFQRGHRRG